MLDGDFPVEHAACGRLRGWHPVRLAARAVGRDRHTSQGLNMVLTAFATQFICLWAGAGTQGLSTRLQSRRMLGGGSAARAAGGGGVLFPGSG